MIYRSFSIPSKAERDWLPRSSSSARSRISRDALAVSFRLIPLSLFPRSISFLAHSTPVCAFEPSLREINYASISTCPCPAARTTFMRLLPFRLLLKTLRGSSRVESSRVKSSQVKSSRQAGGSPASGMVRITTVYGWSCVPSTYNYRKLASFRRAVSSYPPIVSLVSSSVPVSLRRLFVVPPSVATMSDECALFSRAASAPSLWLVHVDQEAR